MTLPPGPGGPRAFHTLGWITRPGPYAARLRRRFGSAEALALYRLNALDASVKGALEHGLPN